MTVRMLAKLCARCAAITGQPPAESGLNCQECGSLILDPRWEWHLVQRFGMPDEYVKIRCLHTEVVPVESGGEQVARLCLTCDTQLPG